MFPLHQIAHVGVSQSRGHKLFGREVILEEFHPMWSRYQVVTDGQTDRQTKAISIPRYALVHRAVKILSPCIANIISVHIPQSFSISKGRKHDGTGLNRETPVSFYDTVCVLRCVRRLPKRLQQTSVWFNPLRYASVSLPSGDCG